MNGAYRLAALAAVVVTLVLSAGCGRSEAPTAASPKPEATPAAEPGVTQPAEITQTVCPVMGGAINKDIYTDHNGKRVYFCCQGCIAEFTKNPAKYLAKLK